MTRPDDWPRFCATTAEMRLMEDLWESFYGERVQFKDIHFHVSRHAIKRVRRHMAQASDENARLHAPPGPDFPAM